MSILGTQIATPILPSMGSLDSSNNDIKPASSQNAMGLEWSKAKPWLESRLQLVLDTSGKTAERDRNQAWKDIQTWKMTGPVAGRAENKAELNQFFDQHANSEMSVKISYLGNKQALTMAAANTSGQNPVTAGLNWAKSLSADDRELFFNAAATPDKFGRYEYQSFDEFISIMSRLEQAWVPPPETSAGASLTRDEKDAMSRLAAVQASQREQLAKLTAEFTGRFGHSSSPTDKIDLSIVGAMAAAETLKQVSAQHQEWLASMEEREAEQAERLNQTDLTAPLQPAQPGTRLSVAA